MGSYRVGTFAIMSNHVKVGIFATEAALAAKVGSEMAAAAAATSAA